MTCYCHRPDRDCKKCREGDGAFEQNISGDPIDGGKQKNRPADS